MSYIVTVPTISLTFTAIDADLRESAESMYTVVSPGFTPVIVPEESTLAILLFALRYLTFLFWSLTAIEYI